MVAKLDVAEVIIFNNIDIMFFRQLCNCFALRLGIASSQRIVAVGNRIKKFSFSFFKNAFQQVNVDSISRAGDTQRSGKITLQELIVIPICRLFD